MIFSGKHRLTLWLEILLFLIGLFWIYQLYMSVYLPDVSYLAHDNPELTAYMLDFQKKHPDVAIHHKWVESPKIAGVLKRAVVAAEDDQFFHHYGFDWPSIKRAAAYNWKKRRFAHGASTLTQQLARNLYLSADKSLWRKLKEFFIAIKLESTLGKDRILELYLNIVEWGPGIFGAEAASHHYFRCAASQLSSEQAAFLASILPNPEKLGHHGFHMTPRVWQILQVM